MNNPEFDINVRYLESAEIFCCELLRDTITHYLPPTFLKVKYPVEVQFTAELDIDDDIEITIQYDPEDNSLTVESEENIYKKQNNNDVEDEEPSVAILTKTCVLNYQTAEIVNYNESVFIFDPPDQNPKYQPDYDEEITDELVRDATNKLTAEKVEYILQLLKSAVID